MEYRILGRSGVRVSRLCLGAMMFGGPTDAATSARMIATAREAGFNFLDTADVYSRGASEEVVSAALAGTRHDWVLATKLGNAMGAGANEKGLSRAWMTRAVEGSLKRLGTDHIDLLYLHREDHDTPLEVTVAALGDLIRAGKIRAFGLSNFRAWRIAALCEACDRLGVDRPVANQPLYHALNRMVEVEVLPVSAHYGLGVFPYSPLARGVLTAKYNPEAAPEPESRAGRGDKRMLEAEWHPASIALAQRLAQHAAARGVSSAHLAIQWVLHNPMITGAIVGPRTEAQLADYIAALDCPYTAADEAVISALVSPGHAATPGYNDPAYRIEGRPGAA
ncbi:aldo/keto reductase [Sediminicoccus sp. KRV36]|uniref:aldo/keto reductase n=1 Tax=Sediminicoccus sp. KRV36 TaxID=3133721 RepID=UPI00200E317D|nr:aldo/keto reductase [Sediminicoccus rosea]UPY37630.1 aldo/keto reductase [Sediminicoccus rosea]